MQLIYGKTKLSNGLGIINQDYEACAVYFFIVFFRILVFAGNEGFEALVSYAIRYKMGKCITCRKWQTGRNDLWKCGYRNHPVE